MYSTVCKNNKGVTFEKKRGDRLTLVKLNFVYWL